MLNGCINGRVTMVGFVRLDQQLTDFSLSFGHLHCNLSVDGLLDFPYVIPFLKAFVEFASVLEIACKLLSDVEQWDARLWIRYFTQDVTSFDQTRIFRFIIAIFSLIFSKGDIEVGDYVNLAI